MRNEFDQKFIIENKSCLDDLYPEFEGLLIKYDNVLYETIATNLTSIHRMKNLYIKNPQPKTTGYQDFANLYSTFGKFEFWKAIGIELNREKVNQLFKNEFGKELRYFE